MLDEKGPLLPHGWVAGDDELGRSSGFRGELRRRNERYLLAVPSNTLIRLVDAASSTESDPGPRPPFRGVAKWCATLPAEAWTKLEVRDAEKGPLVVEVLSARVTAKLSGGREGPEELLFITRERSGPKSFKHDYHLSNAAADTSLAELARVQKAEHRVEDCLKRAKSEAGLADYEVRTWAGWHHHMALSLIATWFLTEETRAVKKNYSGDHRASDSGNDCPATTPKTGLRSSRTDLPQPNPSFTAKRAGQILPLQNAQPLGTQAT